MCPSSKPRPWVPSPTPAARTFGQRRWLQLWPPPSLLASGCTSCAVCLLLETERSSGRSRAARRMVASTHISALFPASTTRAADTFSTRPPARRSHPCPGLADGPSLPRGAQSCVCKLAEDEPWWSGDIRNCLVLPII